MKHLYIRTFILLFACVCGIVGMRAEVLDLTKLMPKVKKGQSYPLTTVEQGGVLLTFSKGEGRVVPANWGYARLYNNNTLTIAAQKNMRKVTLHFLKSGKEVLPKAGEMEVSSGKLTADNVWQGNTQQLVITVYPPKGKTFSLEKVEIAYEEGQTPPTTDPNEDKPKTEENSKYQYVEDKDVTYPIYAVVNVQSVLRFRDNPGISGTNVIGTIENDKTIKVVEKGIEKDRICLA